MLYNEGIKAKSYKLTLFLNLEICFRQN